MTHADAIDAIRRRRARRPVRRRVPPPRPPTAIERRFRSSILASVRRLGALIAQKTGPVLARLDAVADHVPRRRADADESAAFEAALDAASAAWLNEFPFAKLLDFSYDAAEDASLHQRRQFVSQVKAVLGVNVDTVEAWAPQKLVDASETSANLIVTLVGQAVEDVRAHALNAIATGARHETVAKVLEKRLGVTESHAKLLARDQISKIVSDFEQERQVRAGVTRYIWRTVNDNRVRERHEELDGKVFSWEAPPIINPKTGERGHPGDDYQCRCYAEPIFDDIDEEDDGVLVLPPRESMSRPALPPGPRPHASPVRGLPPSPPRAALAVVESKFPKPPTRAFLRVGGAKRPLDQEQQVAEQNTRWLLKTPEARDAASFEERRDWLLWEWVHGSTRATSVLMKEAARLEFGLSGGVYSGGRRRNTPVADVERAKSDLRRIHSETVASFLREGVRQVTLYRGAAGVVEAGVLESWTSNRAVAEQFAAMRSRESGLPGHVEQQIFPVERILVAHSSPGWRTGVFGRQDEFVVMF